MEEALWGSVVVECVQSQMQRYQSLIQGNQVSPGSLNAEY